MISSKWGSWMTHVRSALKSKEAFTYWVGYGAPPFLFGAVIVGFAGGIIFGIINTIIVFSFIYYTINTTCRRCPFYGTNHCPVPGRILPRFLPKLADTSISLRKVKEHYVIDLLMIAYMNILYALAAPFLWPIVFIGSLGALLIVYLPKRHHGLLYRYKELDGATHQDLPTTPEHHLQPDSAGESQNPRRPNLHWWS